MRLIHYSNALVGEVRSVSQSAARSYFDKPRGLWVSVEGEDGWREWCISERFGLERLTHPHEVVLASNAKVLRLNGADEIDALTARYGCAPMDYLPDVVGINWVRVAADYQGIIIAPYVWSRRLHEGSNWYYGWDCASGCIWDAAAVAAVVPADIVPVPEAAEAE